jgi:hypothetical protein
LLVNPYPDYSYPLLTQLTVVHKDTRMKHVLLLACQHLLGPQLEMFRRLIDQHGLVPSNCIIAGKNYSTCQEVMNELQDMGCSVADFSCSFQPLVCFDDWFKEKLIDFVRTQLRGRSLENYSRIIILDDGGFMHEAAQTLLGDDLRLAGIEQTSSGYHRIRKLGIRSNRHMVARSVYKQQLEPHFIAKCAAERIIEHVDEYVKDPPTVLVFGLGAIGRTIAGQLQFDHGMNVWGTDFDYHNPQRMLSHTGTCPLLEAHGRILSYQAACEKIGNFDLIVGATGTPLLSQEQVRSLHAHASLVSVSSSDREFPVLPFRQVENKVHDDCWHNGQCLVNAGFPITFKGRYHEIHPREIELTIAQLMAAVLDLSKKYGAERPSYDLVVAQAAESWQQLVQVG